MITASGRRRKVWEGKVGAEQVMEKEVEQLLLGKKLECRWAM